MENPNCQTSNDINVIPFVINKKYYNATYVHNHNFEKIKLFLKNIFSK
jgi:hypothetical protein